MNRKMPVRNTTVPGSRLRLAINDSKISDLGIQLIYGAAMIFWIVMTYFLNLWVDTSMTTKAILAIPIAVCISNMITPVHGSDIVLDPQVTQGNLLSYILIGASILSPWLSKIDEKRRWHHTRVIKVFVIMVLLLTLSQFDFFTVRYIQDVEVHLNTVINTYALSFIGYCISEFFHIEYRMMDRWALRTPYHEEHPISSYPDRETMTKATMIAASQLT